MDWRRHFRDMSRESSFGGEDDFGVDYTSNSEVIKQVQAKLNSLGQDPPLVVDGAYGPKSKAAVLAYQQSHGLTADGVVGPQTIASLGISPPSGGSVSSAVSAATNWLQSISMPAIAGLKQSMVDAFFSFTSHFEGYTPFMYTDSKGYVTTGIGNLIDNGTSSPAQALPWKHPDGTPATSAEIDAAWHTVKNAYPAVQSVNSQKLTDLRLSKEDVAKLAHSKLKQNHSVLQTQYPNYTSWPAAAQMALHSISWAWGAAFARVWGSNGAAFMAALNRDKPDFRQAAQIMQTASQHEESINPGIRPRNAANMQLFNEAADLQSKGSGFDKLFYPAPVGVIAATAGMLVYFFAGVLAIGAYLMFGGKR